MNVKVELTINGHKRVAEVEPRMHLADFLREHLRLTATHLGCEHGVCGACTVLINGAPARACIALTVALEGADIKTLEGLADDERMAVLKNSFHEQHGLQCGFCTPGMLISAWDLLARKPKISEREIREEMSGNLCRCTGYQGIVRSIKHAAETLGTPSAPERES
jgi:carbon-monoxide dehydrogenase small subunit